MVDHALSSYGDFLLGEWVVQPLLSRITNGDRVERIEPRCMDLLVHLARHPGVVHSRQQLIDEIWRVEAVAQNTLTHAIAALRKALGDDARNPRFIETIYRRGYRLLVSRDGIRDEESKTDRTQSDDHSRRRFSVVNQGPSALDNSRVTMIREVDETPDGDFLIVLTSPNGEAAQKIERGSTPTEVVVRICIEMPEGLRTMPRDEDPPQPPWQQKIS